MTKNTTLTAKGKVKEVKEGKKKSWGKLNFRLSLAYGDVQTSPSSVMQLFSTFPSAFFPRDYRVSFQLRFQHSSIAKRKKVREET